MTHATVELRNGSLVACCYEYHPVTLGQIINLDAARDFKSYEVIELLDAKPRKYRDCNTGEMRDMAVYAYRVAEVAR